MNVTKRLIALAPALALIATGAAAAAITKSGEIKSVDTAKHELVLSSGDTFELGSHIKADALKPGNRVVVSYETKDGKMVASKVTPEKPSK